MDNETKLNNILQKIFKRYPKVKNDIVYWAPEVRALKIYELTGINIQPLIDGVEEETLQKIMCEFLNNITIYCYLLILQMVYD